MKTADQVDERHAVVVLKPTILIDTREKTPWVFSSAVDVERVTLATADYSLRGFSEVVAIERKSAQDLVHSLTVERERFFDCARRMKSYEFRLLVVEASLDDIRAKLYRGRTHPESIIGSTIALYVDYGLPVLWAGSPRNAANVVERILSRIWRKRGEAQAA